MKGILISVFFLLVGIQFAEAQQADSSTLLSAFKRAQITGHLRYFFMTTDNEANLSTYYANAIGGNIHFETANYHGFKLGIGTNFVFNIGSSDFTQKDEQTNAGSRYEASLFDQRDLANKYNLNRLEELHLTYEFRKNKLILGRQLLNTPLLNIQDGRMLPTAFSGLWTSFQVGKNWNIQAGWLIGVAPRGSASFYSIKNSLGYNSVGVNPNGTKSQYEYNVSSNGIGQVGILYTLKKSIKFQLWNAYADNLFNTLLFQADAEYLKKSKRLFYSAVQFIRQDVVNNGGNPDSEKTYFTQHGKAMTTGAKTGWKNDRWDISINYNHIFAIGRYLFPREWGREPFFTYTTREREEGSGGTDKFIGRIFYSWKEKKWMTGLSAGYCHMPDVKNTRLNKYGVPSYYQANAELKHRFTKKLNGLEMHVLIVGKLNAGETYGNLKNVINKVNLANYNLIINYNF